MKLQRFTEYLLANRLRAVLLLAVFSLIPVVGMLGVLFAGFVTLRKGAVEGAMMTVAATLPIVIKFLLMTAGHDSPLSPMVLWTAISFLVICNTLTWLLAVLLYRQMTWSAILQLAALVGVLVISVVHLAYPDVADWWGTQLTQLTASASESAASALSGVMQDSAKLPSEAQIEAINEAKNYASGMIVMFLLLNAVMQLIVARWWQAVLYAPGMLRRELHHIRLSNLAGVLFLLSQVLAWQSNSVVLDILPILYLLFVCAGLSVIHYFLGLMVSPTRWFWVVLLYVMIYYTMPASMMLISLVALMDIWFDLRKRLRKI